MAEIWRGRVVRSVLGKRKIGEQQLALDFFKEAQTTRRHASRTTGWRDDVFAEIRAMTGSGKCSDRNTVEALCVSWLG